VTSIAALLFLLEEEEGDVVMLESPTSMEEPLSIGVGILFLRARGVVDCWKGQAKNQGEGV